MSSKPDFLIPDKIPIDFTQVTLRETLAQEETGFPRPKIPVDSDRIFAEIRSGLVVDPESLFRLFNLKTGNWFSLQLPADKTTETLLFMQTDSDKLDYVDDAQTIIQINQHPNKYGIIQFDTLSISGVINVSGHPIILATMYWLQGTSRNPSPLIQTSISLNGLGISQELLNTSSTFHLPILPKKTKTGDIIYDPLYTATLITKRMVNQVTDEPHNGIGINFFARGFGDRTPIQYARNQLGFQFNTKEDNEVITIPNIQTQIEIPSFLPRVTHH